MMISIFVLLLMFGSGAALLGLIVFAIVSKKLWIIPVGGALLFLCLMAIGILPAIALAPHSRVAVQMPSPNQVAQQVSGMTHTVVQGSPNFNAAISGRPGWLLILIVVLLIAFLLGIVGRTGDTPAAGHGFRRIGTVIAAILIAVFLLGSVRYTSEVSTAATARQTAVEMATQQRAIIAAQQRAADQVRKQHQLAQLDIHKAMDQFDAPHIPLRPDATAAEAPEAPMAPTAPVPPGAVAKPNDKPAAKTNTNDVKKPAAASKQKRKKSDQAPTTGGTQKSQSVAQSKSKDETTAVKENTSSSDKLAMVAEAESEKPNARPAWIDEAPKRVGGGLQREVIVTDLWSTAEECERMRDMLLMVKVYQHLQRIGLVPDSDVESAVLLRPDGNFFADPNVGFTHSPEYDRVRHYLSELGVTLNYARREMAKDEYLEKVDRFSSVGPMLKLYTLVEFSPAVDRELRTRWQNYHRQTRFATLGYCAGSILGLVTLAFALLKIDTWTKGYYTKRLFIGVPAVIIIGLLLMSLKLGSAMRSESGPTVPLSSSSAYSN